MKQAMKIGEALLWAASELKESCDRPCYEAELLLAYHLNCDRLHLHTRERQTVEDLDGFQSFIKRRAANEPYEYITGEVSFYDLHLSVAPGVLIPRPETELLIDRVSTIIEKEGIASLVEIGVGSGAISMVLARKFPHLRIVATDISKEALSIAQQNIDRYQLGEQIRLIKSNLMDEVKDTVEMVISNPPYIANDFELERNVSEYEPHTALFGGEVGDELLKRIITDTYEKGIRWLACEMGYDQKDALQEYVNEIGVEYLDFYQDLSGFDRGFLVKFSGS